MVSAAAAGTDASISVRRLRRGDQAREPRSNATTMKKSPAR